MRTESKEKELEAAGGCTGGSLADKVCNMADMAAPDGSYADMDTGAARALLGFKRVRVEGSGRQWV